VLLDELGLVATTYFTTGSDKDSAETKLPTELVELFNDRILEFQAIADALANAGSGRLRESQRRLLLNLALEMLIDRAELPLATEHLKTKIVATRKAMQENMPWSVQQAVVFFDPHAYNPSMTLRDNLLFGRPNPESPRAAQAQRVATVLEEVIDAGGLRDHVVKAALDYHIGVGGSRLAREQIQKLGLARALLSQAKIIFVCYATSSISASRERSIVEAVCVSARGRGLIWVTDRADLAQTFDRVLEFDGDCLTDKGNV